VLLEQGSDKGLRDALVGAICIFLFLVTPCLLRLLLLLVLLLGWPGPSTLHT
jgi:hypothetical protein